MSMWKRKPRKERPTVKESIGELIWRRLGIWAIPLRIMWAAGHRILYGFSLLVSTWLGRAVGGVAAGGMLLDAGFGSDSVEVYLLEPIAILAALVFGYLAWKRRERWEQHVEAVLHEAVPGHSATTPAVVWYPPSFGTLRLGRWLNRHEFGFRIPGGMTRSQEAEVSEHLRSRVPLREGTSLEITWDWRSGKAKAKLCPDLSETATRPPGEISPDPEKVPLGIGLSGVVYWVLDSNFGNILITGGPGGGKSVLVNCIVRHILEWGAGYFQVYGIDLKGGVELSHLIRYEPVREVADDLDSALVLLRKLRAEVDCRQRLLRETNTKKIADMNPVLEGRGDAPLRRLIILVDELAELTDIPESGGDKAENKARAECKQLLDSIVRLGRAGGVHLVAALQRPDAKYLGGAMRSNIQARVVTGRIDRAGAQMVESSLASELPAIPGRGVLWLGGQEEIVQFYFTRDEDLDLAVLEEEEEVAA